MSETIETGHLINTVPPSLTGTPIIRAVAEAVDQELKAAQALIQKVLIWSRLDELTDAELALIAWGLHRRDYDPTADREIREAKVADALEWHRQGGTRAAVDEVLENLLGGAEHFEHRRRIRFRASRSKAGDRVLGEAKNAFRVDLIIDHERALALGLSHSDIENELAKSWRYTLGCEYKIKMRGFFANRSRPGDLVRKGGSE